MAKDMKPGDTTDKEGMVTPLDFEGRKGGNPDSPKAMDPHEIDPRDPMGFLPKGSKERGKTGPGY
jgi:hypothetical protein